MFNLNNFFKVFKENKKLQYAVNIFILLVIISLILKLDTSKFTSEASEDTSIKNQTQNNSVDSYVYSLENRIVEILKSIEGINDVKVMLYTKNTPELKPVYNEDLSNETNIEIGSDGIKREVKRETKQNEVVLNKDNDVVEKYYQYPEISGVLVVVNYSGDKDIYVILMNSVKTLLNINLNDIEIVITNN